MNTNKIIKEWQTEFKRMGDPARAVKEKSYVRSPFKFYGVGMAGREKMAKKFFTDHRDWSIKDLWQLVWPLWNSGWHELRGLALDLLALYNKKLAYADLPYLEKLLRTSVNWDQVDEISAHLVGSVLARDERVYADLKRWSTDRNFWLRRAAMLSQLILFRQNLGDRQLFYGFATKMMDESWQNFDSWAKNHPEKMGRWFIRKAIGWVLREMSKKWPGEVFQFLRKNKTKLSPLSFKEGSRKLPVEYKEKLEIS
ncbi:MAG: DNA alkylation repair protein [Patescibacteria group bacterium]